MRRGDLVDERANLARADGASLSRLYRANGVSEDILLNDRERGEGFREHGITSSCDMIS